MVCPCKGCEVREAGCHDRCPAYSLWRDELKEIKEKMDWERKLDSFFSEPERWVDHI